MYGLEYFERIYCINLKSRKDRRFLAEKELKKLGINDRVTFFEACENLKNGHIGCLMSHRMIIAEAQKENLNNILVFEDDFEVIEENLKVLDLSIQEIRNKEWGMFYLGCSFFFQDIPYLRQKKGLFEVHGGRSTHAISYNKSFYQTFLDSTSPDKIDTLIKSHIAIDVFLSRFLQEKFTSYMPLKPVCKQRLDLSNTENKVINLDINILKNFNYLSNRTLIINNLFFIVRKFFYFFYQYWNIDLFKVIKYKNYFVFLKKPTAKE